MDATRRTRITLRIITIFLLALILAVIPPILTKSQIMDTFDMSRDAQKQAEQYTEMLRWGHAGGIAAIFALNIVFFIVNEKKGDSGRSLRRRNRMQWWLNFLLLVLGTATLVGLGYSITAYIMIGLFFGTAIPIILLILSPYYIFALCAIFLWYVCMNVAPATNCALRGPLARKIDNKIKRSAHTR